MVLKSFSFKEAINNSKIEELRSKFACLSESANTNILSLHKFLSKSPERFYSEKAFDTYFQFIQTNMKFSIEYFAENRSELEISLRILKEVNDKDIHESPYHTNDLSSMLFIDNHIHYNYLRVLEACFFRFLLPLAQLSRSNRKKSHDKLDLYNVVEELRGGEFDFATTHYNNTIRNGIAHGHIEYTDDDIYYKDKRNTEILHRNDIVRRFDNLLNLINGFSLALTLFFLSNIEHLNALHFKIPLTILVDELQQRINIPGWEILNCLESTKLVHRTQLIIFISNSLWEYMKVSIFTIQTAYWAEFFTQTYDRLFFHIDSTHSILGWAGFDALQLRKAIQCNSESIEDYINSLEEGHVFFIPNWKFPRFLYKLGSFLLSFRVNSPFIIQQLTRNFRRNQFTIRDANIHKNKGQSFLVVGESSSVICGQSSDFIVDLIRNHHKLIINQTIHQAKRKLPFLTRFFPVRSIQVSIYDTDERIRNLRYSGIREELVAVIGFNTSKAIKKINIFSGKLENHGKYRIVWNKTWKGHKSIPFD